MFFLVLRKIANNKWLTACLLIGSVLVVAMVSSIPLYTGGILQRMLIKDLEQYQADTGKYPGRYAVQMNAYSYYNSGNRFGAFNWFDQRMDSQFAAPLGLPYQKVERLGLEYMVFQAANQEKPVDVYSKLYGITDFEKHVQIVEGRLPSAEPANGDIEVVVSLEAQSALNLKLGQELTLTDNTHLVKEPVKVKVVGLYKRPTASDLWWSEPEDAYANAFFMDYNLFKSEIVQKDQAIDSVYWYYAFDYTKLSVENLPSFNCDLSAQKTNILGFAGMSWEFPAQRILGQYAGREGQLKLTLWVLQMPILLMLAFYIFMVSRLIIENDRDEIAVLGSRGASRFQIFASYLAHSLLLSFASVIAGPFAAMAICRVLGASDGFLEFVSRTALPLKMSGQTVLYAVLAGCFSVLMMMIPAIGATRATIVERKQRKARRWSAPLWQKMFLDFILLGISLYGLYQYGLRQKTLLVSQVQGMSVPVDPFLFIISTAFVIGAGLLFLRAYPYAVRLIAWAGRKFWPVTLHTSLVQVGRSGGREQFLMLFLILTISIGVFSANSARTINQNIVDKVSYQNGADIALRMAWPSNAKVTAAADSTPAGVGITPQQPQNEPVTYQEPDFAIYSKLAGTSAAARVFIPDGAVNFKDQRDDSRSGKLMAIVPNEFGLATWSSAQLLPYPINDYLNLLASSPDAVLVSSGLMKDMGLKPGDPISYQWGQQNRVDGVVYASVPYWPGLNPNAADSKYFVVANLNTVQNATSTEPYEIWYKRAPGATTQQIYEDIKVKGMKLSWIVNTEQDIVIKKNDALLQGTNGAMTLGFIVTLAVSLIGFFIYWILSIRARTLQFGIFRAMGMSAGRVMWMLVFEQVLISGAAIFAGVMIGGVMSQLFVPLLGLVYSAADQVPPFIAVASRADYLRLYAVVGVMLSAGLVLLGALVRRIRAAQAIKLGED